MDRYRIAPARPVCLSAAAAGAGVHLRPALAPPPPSSSGHRSSGAEIGIFKAERYFSAADVAVGSSRREDAMMPASSSFHHYPAAHVHDHHLLPPRLSVPAVLDVASSQSGRTAASSEASWNSRSGLLSAGHLAAARPHQQHTASIAGAGAVYGGDHQGYRSSGGGKRTGGGSGQRWTLFGRDCPCAGRKAVTVADDYASEPPRSPAAATAHAHFHAKFSPQSAVEECLESAIFKLKPPSPPPPPRPAAATEDEPATKVTVTVTPGSRAFPLAAAADDDDVPPSFGNPDDIDRRVLRSSFTFPVLGVGVGVGVGVLEEPPRVSLEVFRPIDEDSVMLPEDRPPPPATVGRVGAGLPRGPPAADQEEAMSDASSDLFDLESFAASSSYPTATTTYTYRGWEESRRNSADDDDLPYVSAAAEPALSECMYPASEASVVWSVATAEGVGAFDADAASVANFSSAASACYVDVDDLRYHHRYGYVGVPESSPDEAARFAAVMSRGGAARRKKSGGGGGGGFLGSCRCEKAVSVGPTPVRVVRPPPAHPAGAATKAKRRSGGDGASSRYHHGRSGRDTP